MATPKIVTKHDKLILWMTLGYVIVVCAYMIIHRIWFSPDQFFVFALLGSLVIGQIRLFLLDWIPFISLFLGYEYLRGLVPYISQNVHIFPMIRADELIFGFLPTIKFQDLLYDPSHLHWYDYFLVIVYISHFVVPMVIAYLLWLKDRPYFKKYALGLLVLSYASFLTFILYPAMPPWMASTKGYIPTIKEVTGVVMSHFPTTTLSLPSIYSTIRSNPVAAMPSLHAAYPLLIALFVIRRYRRFGLVLIPYVFGVWFAVIYLGEHYFVDVVAGAAYAIVVYKLVINKEKLLARIHDLFLPRIKLVVARLWSFNRS